MWGIVLLSSNFGFSVVALIMIISVFSIQISQFICFPLKTQSNCWVWAFFIILLHWLSTLNHLWSEITFAFFPSFCAHPWFIFPWKCVNYKQMYKNLAKENHDIVSVCLHVSYPFAHYAIVEGQAYELEGGFLDEVGIEDSDLCRFPRHIVSHRLPKTLCAPLRYWQGNRQEHRQKEGKKNRKLCISSFQH